MNIIFSKHFIYDGVSSKKYNLFFAHVNTKQLENICNESNYQYGYLRGIGSYSCHRDWNDSPLSVDLEIISETPIPTITARKAAFWLFNRGIPAKLYGGVNDPWGSETIDGKRYRTYVNCLFINPKKIMFSGKLYGWSCSCVLTTSMGWQDERSISLSVSASSETSPVTVNAYADSDYPDYIYPKILLTTQSITDFNSDIVITNTMDHEVSTMTLKKPTGGWTTPAGSTICIKSELPMTYYQTASSPISLSKYVEGQKYLTLAPGNNLISIKANGISNARVLWSNRRYLM